MKPKRSWTVALIILPVVSVALATVVILLISMNVYGENEVRVKLIQADSSRDDAVEALLK